MGVVAKTAGKYGGIYGAKGGKIAGSYAGRQIAGKKGAKIGGSVGKVVGKEAGSIGAKTAVSAVPVIGSMKKGGPIHRTGKYLLHKGEYVLNKKVARKMKYM